MKTLVFFLVVALTASLGLAQDFDTSLDAYEADPTPSNLREVSYQASTVEQRDFLEAAVRANGDLDQQEIVYLARAYYTTGDFASAKSFVEANGRWNQYTALFPILLETQANGHTTETAQLATGLNPSTNWSVFIRLPGDADAAWVSMYLDSTQNTNENDALSAFERKTHDPMMRLLKAGSVTKQQAAKFYDDLYMTLWLGYLNSEDQTSERALALEKAATAMKSLRDMLSE